MDALEYGYTALFVASENGDSDVVNHLLEYKQIDVNIQTEVSRMVVHPLFFNIFFKINLSFV